MVIKNRLFTYPVLCGETDDYNEDVEFAVIPNLTETTHELIFSYDFEINNCDALDTLLRMGKICCVLHIECSTTAFRIALKSTTPHIDYRLPKSRVSGEVNLVAMLTAAMDISNYNCPELNEDYAEEMVNFKKGSILAYHNLPAIYVSKKTETLANSDSFFSVVKQASLDVNEIKPLTFNINSDKIQIFVDGRTYDAFVNYRDTEAIAMSMLVLPAVTYMINEVSDNPETYAQYQWFQRLSKYYRANGKDFVEDVLKRDDNPVTIAQEMLQNPVSRAYRSLYNPEGRQ